MTTTQFAFEYVIASWQERLKCEITTSAGSRCQRPATWRADAHGCENRVMCTGHLQNWLRRIEAVLQIADQTKCGLCGRWFCHLDGIQTAVKL